MLTGVALRHFSSGTIITSLGSRAHVELYKAADKKGFNAAALEHGFVTDTGEFLNRYDAMTHARANNQLKNPKLVGNMLHSYDVDLTIPEEEM